MTALYHSSGKLRSLLPLLLVLVMGQQTYAHSGNHGGVPMGIHNVCDDSKTNIEIDWDPTSTDEHTCEDETILTTESHSNTSCERPKMGIHVCYPQSIRYTDIPPTSGQHRPNWPDYGEYIYVPPQRWLHNLEHGAVVMLYHPCASSDEVSKLRNIVTHCLRKHIITPYKLLPRETPFALLTWGCKLTMSKVDPSAALDFIKNHAKKDGPEGMVSKPGSYKTGLMAPAAVVSDYDDSDICPDQPKNDQSASMEEDQANNAYGKGPGGRFGNQGFEDFSNSIFIQSQKRRHFLNDEAEKLDRSIRRLIQVYRNLLTHHLA